MRNQRGQMLPGLIGVVLAVGFFLGLLFLVNGPTRNYTVEPVACPSAAPIVWDNHWDPKTDVTTEGQLVGSPECVHVQFVWTDGGLHWASHTAEVGTFKVLK